MAIGSAILSVFRFIWRALDGLRKVLHLVLLLFLFLILLAMMSTSIPIVPGRAALVLDIQGPIVEQYSGDPLERALGRAAGQIETETRLRDILDAIDAATDDDRIKLIVLDLKDMAGGGLSKLQDVGAALSKFRKGGKKVIATGVYYEQAQYYLAAHADEIYLDPMGLVFMDGYEYYRLFMREAIDKLAIDVNVFKVGTYKSFMEGYTRNDMSPEEREESLAWLGVLWNAYQADVSKARGLQGGALQAYVNDSAALVKGARGDSARVALAQGLVTALKSPADVEEQIKAVVGEDDSTHSFNAVSLESYVAAVHAERRLGRHRGGDVGVVIASGEILDGDQPPGTIGGESAARIIRDARFDDDIRAVVVRVDSPGGSIYASERIYRELKRLREAGKPVIVSMSSTAASGGYYIAAAADEIWAAPTTLTGSIGVFAGIPTFQRTLDKVGLHSDGVGTTKLSGQFRLDRGLGPDARLILQEGVEHAYREFLSRVATNRKKSVEEIDKVAQGRVWAGSAAKERGLVDKLGTLEQAIEAAAVRAGLGEKYDVRFLDPEMTWQEALTMQLRAATASVVERLGFGGRRPELVRKVLDPIEREIQRFARFNDPKNLYSYCFCAPR